MAANRCAISVGAREPLLEWAQQHCTPEQIAAVVAEETLYLIPTYDTDEEAMELLKEGYAGIQGSSGKASPLERQRSCGLGAGLG